jgi:hypothetical protein
MSRKSRMQSARDAKDKRMKKVAVGGAVLLVAVLAFEVPKMMHSGSGSTSSSPPPATTTGASTTTATGVPATSAPGTVLGAVTPTASTKLPNSDAQPRRSRSTLYSFSHFAGKDPFVQQVDDTQAAPTAGTTSASASSGSSGSSGSSSAPQTKRSRTLAATGAARISVNGRIQTVRVAGSFPSSNPLFTLVGISHGVARIGIANGSYASGAHTVTLAAGRTLTLVDTADGIRYRIRLVSAAS